MSVDVHAPGTEPWGWKQQAKGNCRRIIAATPDGDIPVALDDLAFVVDLIRLRTEPETLARKLGGCSPASLIVRSDPLGRSRQFALVRDDGGVVSLSWVAAVEAKWATDPVRYRRQEVLGAMRRAISDQARAALRSFRDAPCALCGSPGNIVADHYPVAFLALAEQFAAEQGEWPAVAASDDTWGSRLAGEFTGAWRVFHERHARFRPLCDPCNLQHVTT